jgi:glycine betaine/proline transport system substrate-binding protein
MVWFCQFAGIEKVMLNMMRLLLGCLFVWASFSIAGVAQDNVQNGAESEKAGPCGTQKLAIAQMQWPSAALLAHVHAILLRQELGCDVQIVAGDLAATASSMATTRQPAIAPEMWITRIADVWNSAIESQNLRSAGDSFSGGAMEGWFVPGSVVQENPKLTSASALKDFAQLFARGGEKARFVSCPPDWACAIINRNLIKALGLADQFEIIEPENRFELDRLIGEAMSSKQPILFYYWRPNAVLAQFDFVQLDLGAYSAEAMKCLGLRACAEPQVSAFPNEPVLIALADWVISDLPPVTAYFQKAKMPLDEMNALLEWQGTAGLGAEETAQHFVETRSALWQTWISRP